MPDGSTERGFGTGLRAKLSGGEVAEPEAPRSPGEAIAAAGTFVPDADVEALRAELSASLAREQELLDSRRHEEEDGRGVAELDRRAAALSATEAELEERERHVLDRLEEVAD